MTKNRFLRNTKKKKKIHKCIPSIRLLQYFHHSVTFLLIGPLVQRASVYLHTDDSSSFAMSNFPVITAWNLSVKGQYLSLPHTHTCLCTHTRCPLVTNENENWNGGKSWAYMGEMKMLIWTRYKTHACCIIPPGVVVSPQQDSISF